MEPKVSSTTIKITRKNGKIIIANEKGDKWKFYDWMDETTAIASLVYQTLQRTYDRMNSYSGDFEIEFTMVQKNNE